MILKCVGLTGFLLCCISVHAELFKASFQAPDNKGRPRTYGIEVELTKSDSDSISGVIKNIYGTNACRWDGITLSGGTTSAGGVRWSSEENPMKGCGRLVFVGHQEGSNWVGHFLRFQGSKIDLVLEPAK